MGLLATLLGHATDVAPKETREFHSINRPLGSPSRSLGSGLNARRHMIRDASHERAVEQAPSAA
jgi:hypothetical protein